MYEIFSSATQYGDIKGDVTIDGTMGGNLHDFAKDNGINTDKYFPVGINIYLGDNGHQSISIIAIDVEQIGIGSTYDNIKDYMESNEEIDIKKFNLPNATFEDYLRICKRFSIAATSIPELMNKKINIS